MLISPTTQNQFYQSVCQGLKHALNQFAENQYADLAPLARQVMRSHGFKSQALGRATAAIASHTEVGVSCAKSK